MSVTLAHDAIHNNLSHMPNGQSMGYTTGTPDIKWTPQDWIAHPIGVRICQDYGSDDTADLIDEERGAASNANVVAWVPKAQAAYLAAKRPGQRWPGCYTSLSNVTPLANALFAAKITNFPLVIAKWDNAEAADAAAILASSGPYPIVGYQYMNGTWFDYDVLSTSWLTNVSRKAVPNTGGNQMQLPGIPGDWKTITVYEAADGTQYAVGLGPNGANIWSTIKKPNGTWSTPVNIA